MRTNVIKEFRGEFDFLSNFYPADFEWRGEVYPTVEHAFQAAKGYHIADSYLKDMTEYMQMVRTAPTPTKAKYHGRSVKIDLDSWHAQRVPYMREIIHAKFGQVQGLAGKLINTGAALLVEGNDWGDTFWGRSRVDGKMIGLNVLGAILMEERGYWLHSNFEDKR